MFSYREWLIHDLKELPTDRRELETITNPLVLNYKQRSIADRERLLAQLTDLERLLIEQNLINGIKAAALTKETGLTVREIQQRREEAFEKLLRLRHGAAYRP